MAAARSRPKSLCRFLGYCLISISFILAIAACKQEGSPKSTRTPRPSSQAKATATAAAALTPIVTSQSEGAQTVASSPACRTGNPLANVYHPDRLQVVEPCKTITGTITLVRHEEDDDYHIDIRLDPPYAGLVNEKNISEQHGDLVAEIVPADEPGCTLGTAPRPATGTYDYGICTGANIPRPKVGQHAMVTGPYVVDTAHGWMEIHPVWALSLVED